MNSRNHKKAIEIIPALMPKSIEDLREKASLVRGLVGTIQVDVMDGKFVPSVDWPFHLADKTPFQKIVEGNNRLPLFEELAYEADLMIQRPEESMQQWIHAGFTRIVIHIESTEQISNILDQWKGLAEIGISINNDTPQSELYYVASRVDFIQFMGIAKIGYQGNPFDDRVLLNISALRNLYPDIIISVDGSVNLETAPSLITAGANRLVIGSAIWESGNIIRAIKKFQTL